MGQQSLIYSFVARGTVILAEFTEFSGNFTSIAAQCLQKLPATNNKFTYNCDAHTFNYLVDNGFTLKRLEGCRTLAEGTKAVINLSLEKVPVPGKPGFPLPGLFPVPRSGEEAELLRNYLKQIREEASGRLLSVAYKSNGTPNKWWLAFAKRKFMNIIVPS